MAISLDLAGRVILVCGANRGGISGATCRQAAAAGATVAAVDIVRESLNDTIADIEAAGGRCQGLLVDLMDPDQAARVVPWVVDRFGRLDGVANVAGGTRDDEWVPLEKTSTDSFRQTVNLNLEYVFRISRDAAAWMIANDRPGAIVNVASVSALTSAPLHGPYGAGKAGMVALTRTMAFEWSKYGIRANTVAPGAVMTERVMSRQSPEEAAAMMKAGDIIPTLPVELANAIVFLLSDLASGVSGQNLVVNSGLTTKFAAGMEKLQGVKRTPQV